MNAFLVGRSYLPRSGLASLQQYREQEGTRSSGVAQGHEGLIEFETLELRLHPPNVNIDQDATPEYTTVTLDSANRPGTLIEVVQCLTELGLNVRRARISSDGGWFVDEFTVDRVTDERKLKAVRRVLSAKTPEEEFQEETVFELAGNDRAGLLADIFMLLKANGYEVRSAAVWTYNARVAFVISVVEQGVSRTVTPLPMTPPAAAIKQPLPTHDAEKLKRLKQRCVMLMDHQNAGDVIANVQVVRGEIHHERRLHQLLLKEEEAQWKEREARQRDAAAANRDDVQHEDMMTSPRSSCSGDSSTTDVVMGHAFSTRSKSSASIRSEAGAQPGSNRASSPVPMQLHHACSTPAAIQTKFTQPAQVTPGQSAPVPVPVPQQPEPVLISQKADKPKIRISYDKKTNYWVVSITCKDRKKLLFDTVCTLADLQFDIYHAAIDTEEDKTVQEKEAVQQGQAGQKKPEIAQQMYYIRPRFGDSAWKPESADKLKSLLETAIQRRFPKGIKIRIQSWQQYDLAALTAAWRDAGLLITRAKVRPCLGGPAGSVSNTFYLLDRNGDAPDPRAVMRACETHGGVPLSLADLSGLVSSVSSSQVSSVANSAGTNQLLGKPPRPVANAPPSPGGPAAAELKERYKGASFGFAVLQRAWDGSASSIASS